MGDFDIDEHIRKKRESETAFGVVKDRRTGSFVSSPSIPKGDRARILPSTRSQITSITQSEGFSKLRDRAQGKKTKQTKTLASLRGKSIILTRDMDRIGSKGELFKITAASREGIHVGVGDRHVYIPNHQNAWFIVEQDAFDQSSIEISPISPEPRSGDDIQNIDALVEEYGMVHDEILNLEQRKEKLRNQILTYARYNKQGLYNSGNYELTIKSRSIYSYPQKGTPEYEKLAEYLRQQGVLARVQTLDKNALGRMFESAGSMRRDLSRFIKQKTSHAFWLRKR